MKIKDPNIKKLFEDHTFKDNRGLNEYIDLLGFPFVNAIKALKHMDHWLDAGAGEARAIREFLLASSKEEIFTTAVTLKISQSVKSSTHKTIVNYLEDLTQESVRPCDIITDISGGLQYSEQPDHLLKRYLLWLKPKGKIFVYVKEGTTTIERGSEILSFEQWIRSIPGLKFTDGSTPEAFCIEKEKSSHAVPRLKLIETRMGDDLIRKFKEA